MCVKWFVPSKCGTTGVCILLSFFHLNSAPPPSSTSQVPDAEDSKVEATEVTRKRHALFDSGTYRVVRGQKSHVKLPVVKSPPDGGKEPASETKQRATFEMRVNASPLISKTSIDQDQTRAAPKMDDPSFKIPPEPKPIPNEDRVAAIIEKVKRSSSFKNKVAQMPKSLPAPPPPADPLGSEAQEALKRMSSQQKFSDLPLPPPPPPPPQIPEKTSSAPRFVLTSRRLEYVASPWAQGLIIIILRVEVRAKLDKPRHYRTLPACLARTNTSLINLLCLTDSATRAQSVIVPALTQRGTGKVCLY